MILLHRTMNLIKKTSKNLLCLPQILNIPHTYYVQQATVCTKCQDITKRIFYYVLKDKYFYIQQAASPWGQGPIKELRRAAASCKKVERRWQQSLHSQTKQSPFLREKIAVVRKNNPKGSKVLGFNDFSYKFETIAPQGSC